MRRCESLLSGGSASPDFVVTLGGPAAVRLLDAGSPPGQAYWLRVWAARGLLWAGPGTDPASLRTALGDDHWRVREMACKVVARHEVGDLLDAVAALERDPVARVRAAASRATMAVVAAAS